MPYQAYVCSTIAEKTRSADRGGLSSVRPGPGPVASDGGGTFVRFGVVFELPFELHSNCCSMARANRAEPAAGWSTAQNVTPPEETQSHGCPTSPPGRISVEDPRIVRGHFYGHGYGYFYGYGHFYGQGQSQSHGQSHGHGQGHFYGQGQGHGHIRIHDGGQATAAAAGDRQHRSGHRWRPPWCRR